MALRFDEGEFSDGTAVDLFDELAQAVIRMPLQSDHEDGFCMAYHTKHVAHRLWRDGQRLFTVNVLACVQRCRSHLRVQIARSCNEDSVDVLSLQQTLVVGKRGWGIAGCGCDGLIEPV